jgi:RNA polymerase sigma-70 factor, ECF subfamily
VGREDPLGPPRDDRGPADRVRARGGAGIVEAVFRREWGRCVAYLARVLGDLELAEDAVQDAFATALERWPRDGVPSSPGAWIARTGRNAAIDRLRREQVLERKRELLARLEETAEPMPDDESSIPDERLGLIFACCHPALAADVRVPLTLRMLGGLSTKAIARAFLVPEPTLAQRLARAKRKIREAGIPLGVPSDPLLPERLRGVLAVLYLIFNEGFSSHRSELADEAIRLAKLLAVLMPDEPEALGLLALMLLHDSRRDARVDATGELVLLSDQDRSRWNRAEIDEGRRVLERALSFRQPDPYQLQAAIAAVHADATDPADTDWAQIAVLYDQLARIDPSPVVALNRAVAIAMAEGPEQGLELIERLAGALDGYHLFHSARADLLRRLGREEESAAAYGRAIALAPEGPDRRFLEQRLAGAR